MIASIIKHTKNIFPNYTFWEKKIPINSFLGKQTKHTLKRGDKKNLFEFVEDFIGVGEVPVEEKLVNDGEIVAGFREAREDLLHVTLGLLLDQAPEPREEPSLAGQAFEPRVGGSGRTVRNGASPGES